MADSFWVNDSNEFLIDENGDFYFDDFCCCGCPCCDAMQLKMTGVANGTCNCAAGNFTLCIGLTGPFCKGIAVHDPAFTCPGPPSEDFAITVVWDIVDNGDGTCTISGAAGNYGEGPGSAMGGNVTFTTRQCSNITGIFQDDNTFNQECDLRNAVFEVTGDCIP